MDIIKAIEQENLNPNAPVFPSATQSRFSLRLSKETRKEFRLMKA